MMIIIIFLYLQVFENIKIDFFSKRYIPLYAHIRVNSSIQVWF